MNDQKKKCIFSPLRPKKNCLDLTRREVTADTRTSAVQLVMRCLISVFVSPYRSSDWKVDAEIGFGRSVERQRNDRRRRAVCSARAPVDNGRVSDRADGDEDNVLKTPRSPVSNVLSYYII